MSLPEPEHGPSPDRPPDASRPDDASATGPARPGGPGADEPRAEGPSDAPPALSEAALADLRARIDDVDRRVIEALSERARIVTEIGRSKRSSGYPIYAPHREAEVLRRVLEANPGPLPGRTLEAIYRELMSGSFMLEQPIRVAYLGPEGSFSHVAAGRHFGQSVDHVPLEGIEGVFEEVATGRVTYGLVPYENSIGGGITDTLDAFQGHEVTIYAEALIEVRHNLLANVPPERIRRIHSKPQVFAQCRRFLAARFPEAELVPALSSSDAVRRAAEDGAQGETAAIGSSLAGEIYGVNTLFEHVEDTAGNITRFLVLAREAARPSGDDRTSIMFTTAHRPGALVDVLAVFRDHGLNLSHIEKRPSRRENWEYTFFVDVDVHHETDPAPAAIEAARAHTRSLRVLGSYPRARRIL
jgi:chorismate mutase/prephenate dehydratase